MGTILFLWSTCLVYVTIADGTVFQTAAKQQSSCGSWIPYADAKCVRIADIAVVQTKQEADAVCSIFAETEGLDDIPRLVTVRNDKEQAALKHLLFEELGLLDHVWLGVERSVEGVLRWNNGLKLYFNNLAEQNVTKIDQQCVQMESGQGVYPMGQWVMTNCRKRNVVVCEKINVWTLAKLQNSFLNFQSQVERQIKELGRAQEREVKTQMKTETLERTSVATSSLTKESSRCGNWKSYKDQKCFKVASYAGYQVKEDAEFMCQSLTEELNQESLPRLMTVKTKEEQEFLQRFLFGESNIVDNVWLGLKQNENLGEYEWNDGTNVVYSNWANQNVEKEHNECVQMVTGQGLVAEGLWVRVTCKKGGIVVCERSQTWTIELLQNMFLNYKLEQEQEKQKFKDEIVLLNQKHDALIKEINPLKQNPVPLGFIYIQLPNQEPPSTLWPLTNWTDVSPLYSGLFFRVVGGKAAPFGQIQEGDSSRLIQAQYSTGVANTRILTIPSDGSWSQYIFSGTHYSKGTDLYQQFRMSGEEVRPRNQAVIIWQRSD